MNKSSKRRGQSLLEVVAASTIIAVALVPALRMMRDSLQISRDLEEADLMSTLCVDKLEEHLAKTAATWDKSTVTGDYAALEGRSYLRFRVTRSDSPSDGGMNDRLMALVAVVWNDADGNGDPGPSEKKVTYATKVSKFVSYTDYEAKGM